jgi:acyl carrier protein
VKPIPDLNALEQKVVEAVAASLGIDASQITPFASLVDDLGAESIDFIDIVFDLESTFDTIIPSDELWAGAVDVDTKDPASVAQAIAALRASTPELAWSTLPETIANRDLPRLITVRSIATYLARHLQAEAGSGT